MKVSPQRNGDSESAKALSATDKRRPRYKPGGLVSSPSRAEVEVSVSLRLLISDADSVAIPVGLRYNAEDPYAITVAFHCDDVSVEWVFARDLLIEGQLRPCGVGDVRVWPGTREGSDVTFLCLSSPDGQAVLEGDTAELRKFLEQTYKVVRPGREATGIDFDAQIAALLS